MYTANCQQIILHYDRFNVNCNTQLTALYSVQCRQLGSLHFTGQKDTACNQLVQLQCTVCILQFTVHSTVDQDQCTVHGAQCTVHCTLVRGSVPAVISGFLPSNEAQPKGDCWIEEQHMRIGGWVSICSLVRNLAQQRLRPKDTDSKRAKSILWCVCSMCLCFTSGVFSSIQSEEEHNSQQAASLERSMTNYD